MSTVQTIFSAVGYRIFDNISQTIGASTQPSITECYRWLNDGIFILNSILAERKSVLGSVDGQFNTVAAAQISTISKANPAVVTTVEAHGFSSTDTVFVQGVSGMREVNQTTYNITVLTTTTFSLQTVAAIPVDVDSSSYTAYSGNGIVTTKRYYNNLAALAYAYTDLGTVYDENEETDFKKVPPDRKKNWDLNTIGVPCEFYLDANKYIYPLPIPDDVYIIELKYWPIMTALAALDGTVPWSGYFDQFIIEGMVHVYQNRAEYDLQSEDLWREFLWKRISNTIRSFNSFKSNFSG